MPFFYNVVLFVAFYASAGWLALQVAPEGIGSELTSLGVGGTIALVVIYWKRSDDVKHAEELNRLREAHSDFIEQLKKDHAEETKALRDTHERRFGELVDRYHLDHEAQVDATERFAGGLEEVSKLMQALAVVQRFEDRVSALERGPVSSRSP